MVSPFSHIADGGAIHTTGDADLFNFALPPPGIAKEQRKNQTRTNVMTYISPAQKVVPSHIHGELET